MSGRWERGWWVGRCVYVQLVSPSAGTILTDLGVSYSFGSDDR